MDHCHASCVRSLLNSASRLTLNWRAKSLIAVDGERKSWPAVAGYDEREPTGAASRNGAKNGATGSAVPDADRCCAKEMRRLLPPSLTTDRR
jgi:hypothetical protein